MVSNAKKVQAIEEVQRPILIKLYKLYINSHQNLEIFQNSIVKTAKFLGMFHINIEGPLLITFLSI